MPPRRRPGDLAAARARHRVRQRWFDLFKRLRAGEPVAAFAFDDARGRSVVARDITPMNFYVQWLEPRDGSCDLYVAFAGRGRDGAPGVHRLCWKDAGDPYVYDLAPGVSRPPDGPRAGGRIVVPVRHVYGRVGRLELAGAAETP